MSLVSVCEALSVAVLVISTITVLYPMFACVEIAPTGAKYTLRLQDNNGVSVCALSGEWDTGETALIGGYSFWKDNCFIIS